MPSAYYKIAVTQCTCDVWKLAQVFKAHCSYVQQQRLANSGALTCALHHLHIQLLNLSQPQL